MTRDGFCILVMGFTGAEAMAWKLRRWGYPPKCPLQKCEKGYDYSDAAGFPRAAPLATRPHREHPPPGVRSRRRLNRVGKAAARPG